MRLIKSRSMRTIWNIVIIHVVIQVKKTVFKEAAKDLLMSGKFDREVLAALDMSRSKKNINLS